MSLSEFAFGGTKICRKNCVLSEIKQLPFRIRKGSMAVRSYFWLGPVKLSGLLAMVINLKNNLACIYVLRIHLYVHFKKTFSAS